MTIGQRIKQRRVELNMSQEELAKKMGYSTRNAVYQFEKKDNMKLSIIEKFAEALDTTPGFLMGWEDIDGNPIARPEKEYPIKISDYRTDFVKEAIQVYQDIQRLSPERRQALEEYLRYLKSQS